MEEVVWRTPGVCALPAKGMGVESDVADGKRPSLGKVVHGPQLATPCRLIDHVPVPLQLWVAPVARAAGHLKVFCWGDRWTFL